jgi:2-iminobutanoate/2-iminopropanoate deaminase
MRDGLTHRAQASHPRRAIILYRNSMGALTMVIRSTALFAAVALAGLSAGAVQAAQYLEPTNAQRSYGAGVVTEGGRIVWLAGMGGTLAPDGKKIADFAGQTRQAFHNIEAALQRAGGSLENLVSMTVMIRNQSDGDEFVKVRGEFFKSKFPASMLITAKDFANPDLLVEIQSVAVIGDQLK